MSNNSPSSKISDLFKRIQVGPGFGLLLMGTLYLVFWLMPFALEEYAKDPRWAHNWAYAIILMTIGAAFHHKSVVSRIIAMIQGLMMPLTASGAFNAEMMTLITIVIGAAWLIVMLIERLSKKMMLQDRLSKRSWNWINMHSVIVCWILMAHMGLVFFIGRLPFEAEMAAIGAQLGRNIGILANLPEERFELVTYVFDINLIILALLFGYEQFKLGYNIQNKPWSRISFWYIGVTLVLGIVLLPFDLEMGLTLPELVIVPILKEVLGFF